jgi:hexosaminidase
MGWQESARAGLEPGDVVQHWIDGAVAGGVASLEDLPDGVRQLVEEITGSAAADLATSVERGARLVLSPTSHCYLDTRYAGPGADDADEALRRRLGLPFYPRRTVEAFWDWDPFAAPSLDGLDGFDPSVHVAGVSAALWAETIRHFDDASFLLLPRLPGVADRAWGAGRPRDWAGHRARLAAHAPMWAALGLRWFGGTEVDWAADPS